MKIDFTHCEIQIKYDTVYNLQHQADFQIDVKYRCTEKIK